MGPALLDSVAYEASAGADLLIVEVRHGPVRRRRHRRDRGGRRRRACRPPSPAGPARARCCRPGAIRRRNGARLCQLRSARPHRRHRSEPRRQRPPSRLDRTRHRHARHPGGRRHPARQGRSISPSVISVWCRRSSTTTSSFACIASPISPSAIAISPAFKVSPPLSTVGARPISALPPPGQRIALASDAAFAFIYPHVLERLAARWRRDRALLAACRRAAARRLRCLLAARRLSGAACRHARQRGTLQGRARPLRRERAGARRVRRLHGAGAGAGRCRRRAPRHDRAALPCDELRRAPPASRLSRRDAAAGLPARAAGHAPARSRVPLRLADRARAPMRRSPSCSTRTATRLGRAADGAGMSPAPSSTPSPARRSLPDEQKLAKLA